MRWPWKRRTDEELQRLAVEIFSAICSACASCPSSQHGAATAAVTREAIARAGLKAADERRLVATMGALNEMLMADALAEREPAGTA